jgi:ubiquinone/menaquinone biosynthesis C-methylase UbiE
MQSSPYVGWAEGTDDVRRRYRRLTTIYPLFEQLLWLPWGIRAKAVHRLALDPGDRVLEVGCGTGRNLAFLVKAVGPTGRVYGVDVTPEMLAVARKTSTKHGWSNVILLVGDAEAVELPEHVDAVLFSLSYAVIPRHQAVLEAVWKSLRPGGRIVILDAAIPQGGLGEVLRPVAVSLSRRTVLGNPDKRPWEDLGKLTRDVHREQIWPGIYYICWGDRSATSSAPNPSPRGSS